MNKQQRHGILTAKETFCEFMILWSTAQLSRYFSLDNMVKRPYIQYYREERLSRVRANGYRPYVKKKKKKKFLGELILNLITFPVFEK